ncbi:Uncharacterized protein FKW44_003789 [Caligus rogercresseyi]|uniref:Uncharacterized protein n=1 Tax=Caligus rogercresseyi TaxID=217165 RepID=A0A7T8KM55_CALRO|nr:Uncharacterized protein FKW44_003789 [Caligus rogercresseyi]
MYKLRLQRRSSGNSHQEDKMLVQTLSPYIWRKRLDAQKSLLSPQFRQSVK